jgi:hypothetical protein
MVKVIQADTTNTCGQRNVIDSEAELLRGFEFNSNGRLDGTLYALTVNIPAFVPIHMVATPAGATHFKIVMAGAEVIFEVDQFVNGSAASEQLPLDVTPTTELNLSVNVTANSTNPLFVVLGIRSISR